MEASPFGDMRILIADDQKDVGRSLADLVRYCNHQVVGVVGSGLEAIQAYARHHPDLILMDYRMPKLNGATACRNILSKDPAARVILVSAWSPSDDASASGAIAMLPKPVSLEQLNAALNRVAETLSVPSPAEAPIPEFYYQPDPIDYPITYSQFVDQPTPSSELEAPNLSPLHVDPPPPESTFSVVAPWTEPEQTTEEYAPTILDQAPKSDAMALVAEKKSRKPHLTPRRAQRSRVR
jgi:CheY-like chemotaxis protein